MSDIWPEGLAQGWHPIAYESDLGQQPLACQLLGRPLVVFRARDGVAVLEDRCPHRNVPLSRGRCRDGEIACPYHGWRFDGSGTCRHIPGATKPIAAPVPAYPVHLHLGLVWTTLTQTPSPFPQLPSLVTDPAYDTFWWKLPAARATIGDAIENLLDPVHAYFLHPGLVRRTSGPNAVDIDFAISPEGAEARYVEPREGMTWLQKLTEGNRTASWGRYRAPTQVQIGFEDAKGVHASIFVTFSPVNDRDTPLRLFFHAARHGAGLAQALVHHPFHRLVLDQDQHMLKLQAEHCQNFEGPHYRQGPLDLFGLVIWEGLNARTLEPQRRQLRLACQP
jgi:phenylpropionate dioxygenase-like ring-hydroxylating dioxygenase large terminal subunit